MFWDERSGEALLDQGDGGGGGGGGSDTKAFTWSGTADSGHKISFSAP